MSDAETMENMLAVLKGNGNTQDVVVESTPFNIGRCRSAKLILPNVNISRNHCVLIQTQNFEWIIEDYSSTGTYVNNELVEKGMSRVINNNDVLTVGPKECNLSWQFKTILPTDNNINNVHGFGSKALVDICSKKNTLQKKIILNRESHKKMIIEKEELHKQCLDQVEALEKKYLTERQSLEKNAENFQSEIAKLEEEEKKKIYNEMEKKLGVLQCKIEESNKVEREFKAEIQKLQEQMICEKVQLENRFLREKEMLEEKIRQQELILNDEKMKVKQISEMHEQQLEDKLKKEEEEKRILLDKLREMEEAKEILSKKLKESNELHLLDKARMEEAMQKELTEKERNIKAQLQEQIDHLKKTQSEIEKNLKVELQEKEKNRHEDLLKELNRVKNTLVQAECRQKLLEKELEEASSHKSDASKERSQILENIAELMETELQCSVCSELFVTAITLNCTHTFCQYCITRWKKKKKNCPICRKKIMSENRSIVMDNYIEKMVENLSEEFRNRRDAIIAERNPGGAKKKMKPNSASSSSTRNNQNSSESSSRRSGGRAAVNEDRNTRESSREESDFDSSSFYSSMDESEDYLFDGDYRYCVYCRDCHFGDCY